ncbi:MAG: hypothetical protein LKJ83_02880 [Eubacteriaceae bacterium]|nr:hypothetical protein [Eubacteriaceae bacterium]
MLWNNSILKPAFFAGCVLFAVSAAGIVRDSYLVCSPLSGLNKGALAVSVFFALLTVYTLFFALPFRKVYVYPGSGGRKVCRNGFYGLCRHPAVMWFILCFVFLGAGLPAQECIIGGILFCAADVAYIVIQDVWSFPNSFADYDDYKKEVPFLLPTSASIRKCISTLR